MCIDKLVVCGPNERPSSLLVHSTFQIQEAIRYNAKQQLLILLLSTSG